MDAATKEKVEETVVEILRTADMLKMTEFNVRTLAGEKLGIDLSEPSRKKFVRQIVEGFLQQQQQIDAPEGGSGGGEVEEVQQEEEQEEEEEESNKRRSDGKEYDEAGDLIICQVSSLIPFSVLNLFNLWFCNTCF